MTENTPLTSETYQRARGFRFGPTKLDPDFTEAEVMRIIDRYRAAFPQLMQYSTVQEDTMNDITEGSYPEGHDDITEDATAPTKLTLDSIVLAGHTYNGPIELELTRYLDPDAGTAIILVTRENGYPDLLSKVTINLGQYGSYPRPGCVFVKDYSESAGMMAAMEAAGWMKPTGRWFQAGFVEVPEAELTGDLERLWKAGQTA
ncbi:hypothetical protein HOT31_gp093 [Microbacterium phage Hendrix]|uniref:Uncharacterized protein n=1 Tax=Microbacterium phage Hendrix TaxID=2182341 RepID=A0A2U8UUB4_9CAUD|nr:hypothetical protein HOT31_gp093 [Microbacterium phage Hendrix]AWN07764.1 hypothetical protein PBI_HENDRIX_93 [Microbacterium phage Hendrix]